VALALAMTFALSACTSTPAPTASTSSTPSSSAVIPTSAASPSAAAGSPATSSASVPPGGTGPVCAVASQSGLLPSDRLVDLQISSTTTHDLLTFEFATSAPGPAGPARGALEAATPPFSFAGSGQPIDLVGQHAVQVRFSGMTLASETGEATYKGPTEAKPGLPALREAIQFDASEGIVGWLVGYDGPGCVTLVREGNSVTVMIAHPEAPAG
jgi:hypothetical protein